MIIGTINTKLAAVSATKTNRMVRLKRGKVTNLNLSKVFAPSIDAAS